MKTKTDSELKAKTVQKKAKLKESVKMWGKPVLSAGFTILPSTLLLKQKQLGLDAVDVNILLHLLVTWWKKDQLPHLSKKTIAARMGIDPSTVQRHVRKMEKLKLVKRVERRGSNKALQTNQYDLRPLVAALHLQANNVKKERAAKKQMNALKGGK
ncbi:MAG TPA: helix-turn-helix domain-containing protein [Gemmata sp.]